MIFQLIPRGSMGKLNSVIACILAATQIKFKYKEKNKPFISKGA